MKNFIFIQKDSGRISLYGSLKALYDVEKELIQRSKQTLYNSHDFELEDYEDQVCKIAQRTVRRSKQANFI